jgi:ATP-dependent exoDNAse (exonuclease V) alpha subunit
MAVDNLNAIPCKGWIHMYQFSIRIAYVCTAHKAQGQTLDHIAICIDKKAFSHDDFYVVLSRVRSLNKVTLFAESH